jgi:DNA-binding Lrp family transcriptional regulator
MKTPEIRHRNRHDVTDLFPSNQNLSDDSDSRRMQLRRDVRHLRRKDLIKRYSAEWNCFRAMKGRASRGVAVVDPRLDRFKNFLEVLGPCPRRGWTVDRIDPFDPEYAPGKVRWASKVTQANNRTNTIMLSSADGRVRSLAEWARATRQKPDTLRKRYERGWADEEIISGTRLDCRPAPNITRQHRRTGNWPALVGDERPFESAWRAWISQSDWGRMSRETLVLWLLLNRQRRRSMLLQQRYPDQFGEHSNPYGDLGPPLTDDPDYRTYLRASALIEEMQARLDATQQRLLLRLINNEPMVFHTRDVIERAAQRRAAASEHARSYFD